MGGLGSRRRGWKPKAEHLLSLDIRTIHKDTPLREGQFLYISHPDATSGVNISLAWTALNYGGQRPWFICPGCGERVAILYLYSHQFLCRECHGITYSSRCEGTLDILLGREGKIFEKLGRQLFSKPKWMHQKTFGGILREYLEIERQIDKQIENRFGKFF